VSIDLVLQMLSMLRGNKVRLANVVANGYFFWGGGITRVHVVGGLDGAQIKVQ